jgi:hypothetical protein
MRGLVFWIGLATLPVNLAAQVDTLDVTFTSTTTIQKPSSDTLHVRFDPTVTRPFSQKFLVRPVQGTFSVTYDAGLVATWEQDSVAVGTDLPIAVAWAFPSGVFGTARMRQALYLEPEYTIDFDSLFASSRFGPLDPNYPVAGVRSGKIPLSQPLRLDLSGAFVIPKTNLDPLLLDTAYSPYSVLTPVDSLVFASGFSPYPCIQIETTFKAVAKVDWAVQNAEVCIRYSNAADDTLCWSFADSALTSAHDFNCITTSSWSDTINVTLPCRETRQATIPFCPAVARGTLDLDVVLDLQLLDYRVVYTCSSVPSLLDTLVYDGGLTRSRAIYDQTVQLDRARDDAIFTVPVSMDSILMISPVSAAECTVGAVCPVRWGTSFDSALLACCGTDTIKTNLYYLPTNSFTSRSVHQDSLAIIDSLFVCSGTIATHVDASSGSVDWTVPSRSCFDGSTEFLILGEFTCGSTIIAYSRSEAFVIRPQPATGAR